MATQLKQLLAACSFALAACALCAAPASAADNATHPKAKKVVKHKSKAKAAKAQEQAAPDEPEPDIADAVSTEYNCELGNKVTIYSSAKDDSHIALRWQKHLHRLTRVDTTTGAQRFENPSFGLVWINIPSKGLLLDSKQKRQLANDCKSAEQRQSVAAGAQPDMKS